MRGHILPGISVWWQVGSSMGMTIAVLSSPEVYKHLLALWMLAKREEVLISPKRVISSTLPTLSRSSEKAMDKYIERYRLQWKALSLDIPCLVLTNSQLLRLPTWDLCKTKPAKNPNVNRVELLQASPLNVELLGVYSFCGERELLVFWGCSHWWVSMVWCVVPHQCTHEEDDLYLVVAHQK